jgi:hypothetical protein
MLKEFLKSFSEHVEFFHKPLHENWLGTDMYKQRKVDIKNLKPIIEKIDKSMRGKEHN